VVVAVVVVAVSNEVSRQERWPKAKSWSQGLQADRGSCWRKLAAASA